MASVPREAVLVRVLHIFFFFENGAHANGQVLAFPVDVRKEGDVSAVYDFMEKNVGLPDIIINNAYVAQTGVAPRNPNEPELPSGILCCCLRAALGTLSVPRSDCLRTRGAPWWTLC